MATRPARFDGQFYASEAGDLKRQIKKSFLSDVGPQELPPANKSMNEELCAVIVPHAGYQYSGPIAAWAYLQASKYIPKTVLLIGPNHSGFGPEVAIYPEGSWTTPLGKNSINDELAHKIADQGFTLDTSAHKYEHSIEVQLPFLQYIFEHEFNIIAVSMLDQSLATTLKLSKAIANAIKDNDVLIVATTDLSHYENDKSTRKKDSELINKLLKGNIESIYKAVARASISACGVGPAAVAINTCALLGAQDIRLLKYETSAAASGDKDSVVGYSSLGILK